MDEQKQLGNTLDRTTAFIGFAIAFALLLAFAAYFVVQVNQLNNRISTTGNTDVSDRLLAIENRLSLVEQALTPPTVKLKLFYDSSDNFTKDVVEKIAAAQAQLASQNLQITLSDRSKDMGQYRKDGFNEIPALYISKAEASRDPVLLKSVQQENQAFDGNIEGFRIEALGFVYDRKRMLETECKLPAGKVNLYQFTNFECPFCAAMYPQLQNYVATHGNAIEFTQRHLPLKSRPNAWNASIASECARDQGKFDAFSQAAYLANANLSTAKYLEIAKAIGVADMAKFTTCLSDEKNGLVVNRDFTEGSLTYGLRSAPIFVADCKYAFVALTEQQLADQLCKAYPDKCDKFALTNATASPTPAASPSATPKASPTPKP